MTDSAEPDNPFAADVPGVEVQPATYVLFGASGDLAPLAHLCLPLIGMGEVRINGEKFPAARALEKFGLKPVALKSKEGLA